MAKAKNVGGAAAVIENQAEAPVETKTEQAQAEQVVKELTARQKFRLQRIKLLVDTNPKKKPSMSYDRFQDYFGLPTEDDKLVTVDWALRNTAIRMDDIRHDSAHQFIELRA